MQIKSRTMSIQLEGSTLGSVPPVERVIVDKVGMYAYPLQFSTLRRSQAPATSKPGFHNAAIVSVSSRRRTKLISVQTPYRLLNHTPLPLQFKVRRHDIYA